MGHTTMAACAVKWACLFCSIASCICGYADHDGNIYYKLACVGPSFTFSCPGNDYIHLTNVTLLVTNDRTPNATFCKDPVREKSHCSSKPDSDKPESDIENYFFECNSHSTCNRSATLEMIRDELATCNTHGQKYIVLKYECLPSAVTMFRMEHTDSMQTGTGITYLVSPGYGKMSNSTYVCRMKYTPRVGAYGLNVTLTTEVIDGFSRPSLCNYQMRFKEDTHFSTKIYTFCLDKVAHGLVSSHTLNAGNGFLVHFVRGYQANVVVGRVWVKISAQSMDESVPGLGQFGVFCVSQSELTLPPTTARYTEPPVPTQSFSASASSTVPSGGAPIIHTKDVAKMEKEKEDDYDKYKYVALGMGLALFLLAAIALIISIMRSKDDDQKGLLKNNLDDAEAEVGGVDNNQELPADDVAAETSGREKQDEAKTHELY